MEFRTFQKKLFYYTYESLQKWGKLNIEQRFKENTQPGFYYKKPLQMEHVAGIILLCEF